MEELLLEKDAKILVVAPHPDDETLGCGGLLLKYSTQCDVLVLTDGSMGISNSLSNFEKENIVEFRKNEIKNAMQYANINKLYFLDIPDTKVIFNYGKIKKFNIRQYNYIFCPNYREKHTDHYKVFSFFKKIIKKQKNKAKIFMYEVWTPLINPNYYINLSFSIEKKLQMISFYKTQIACFDYEAICEGLNKYRGASYNKNYIECYYYENNIIKLKNIIFKFLKKLKCYINYYRE